MSASQQMHRALDSTAGCWYTNTVPLNTSLPPDCTHLTLASGVLFLSTIAAQYLTSVSLEVRIPSTTQSLARCISLRCSRSEMATGIILANSFPLPPPLSTESLTSLRSILQRLHTRISHYRPLILPNFQDFDSNHTGTVSHDQFARVLTLVKCELQRDELQLLTHAYLAADISRVDYRRFLNDVDNDKNTTYKRAEESKEAIAEYEATKDNSILTRTSGPYTAAGAGRKRPTLQLTLHKLQTLIAQQRKHITDIFDDFDPLRKRRVTQSQFVRCLTVNGLQLDSEEVNTLLDAYTGKQGEVEYQRFVLDINSAFIPYQPEMSPSSAAPTFTPLPLHLAPPVSMSSTGIVTDTASLDALLSRMAYLTSTRRILLKPAFAAHDLQHAGCISLPAFCSVLHSLFPSLSLSRAEMESVAGQYGRGEQGVSYVEFCREVARREKQYESDEQQRAHRKETNITQHNQHLTPTAAGVNTDATLDLSNSLTSSSPLASPFTSTLSRPLPNLPALIHSLRITLQWHRLDLSTVFDDFDRLRRGSVTRDVFYRVLSMWGLRVRQEEVDMLAEAFAAKGEGREGEVNYAAFLASLSEIPKF